MLKSYSANMERKIKECQTLAEIEVLERKIKILQRVREWRLENKRLGIVSNLTDTWTPEQRDRFLREWRDDEILTHGQKRPYEETDSEEPQVGRGQDDDDNGLFVKETSQVNVKKFKTTGMRYHIQFTNAFANKELFEYHDRLHEIFHSLLDEVIRGVSPHDQVRFVLQSQQLEKGEFEKVIQSNRDFRPVSGSRSQ